MYIYIYKYVYIQICIYIYINGKVIYNFSVYKYGIYIY